MSRLRWVILSGVAVAIIAVSFVALSPAPSLRDIDGVKEGMSQQEVEAILGPPTFAEMNNPTKFKLCGWACKDGSCTVTYDVDDKASVIHVHPDNYWWQSLCRRLFWRI